VYVNDMEFSGNNLSAVALETNYLLLMIKTGRGRVGGSKVKVCMCLKDVCLSYDLVFAHISLRDLLTGSKTGINFRVGSLLQESRLWFFSEATRE